MRLPTHITGLIDHKSDVQKMDTQVFKKLGYEIARRFHGEVTGYVPPAYPLNYSRLHIKVDGNTLSVLLHEYFPYVAMAIYENEHQIQYVDSEELMDAWRPYYTVLETAFLHEPFTPDAHNLSESELENEKKWGPNTNGDVIFNSWD